MALASREAALVDENARLKAELQAATIHVDWLTLQLKEAGLIPEIPVMLAETDVDRFLDRAFKAIDQTRAAWFDREEKRTPVRVTIEDPDD
jgi:hypothetical protein